MARIRSESAEFQLLEALRHNRRKRTQRGEFLIDGVQPINRALAAGWPIRAVLTPESATPSSWARSVIDACRAPSGSGADHHIVRADLFARLADRDDPPEVLLVGAMATTTLDDIVPPADGVVVVVDRPSSPGNLGTILRTSDALGAAAVLTVGHGAHLYDPHTIRASVGSLFSIPVVAVAGPAELEPWLEAWRARAPLTVYATDEDGDRDVADLTDVDDLDRDPAQGPRPAALLMGSERTGLARGLRELADATIRIPMTGTASSLNVAVAHGIVLHALLR
jgi:TrmH family RNA methyltransferase